MRCVRRFFAAAAAVALLAPLALAEVHRDDDLGWTMQMPRGWKRIPLPPDEEWVVAKYLCDRAYPTRDGWEYTPDFKVVYFPASRLQKPKVEKKEVGEGVTIVGARKSYRDFKEYLKENASGGGFYVSKEEEVTINGIAATWLEVKYEKLTTPRRGLAVVFHRDVGADYAVTFEVLEDQWDKLGKELAGLVKTFKFIEAKKDLRAGTSSGGSEEAPPRPADEAPGAAGPPKPKEDFNSPEARRRRRDAEYGKQLAHARSTLGQGWKEMKSKNFIAITHVDDKYTKRCLDQAEAVRAWLDRTFGALGGGEAGPLLIRICESTDEERAFRDTTSGTGWLSLVGAGSVTLVTHKEVGSARENLEFQYVNSRVLSSWFADRVPDMAWGVPDWIQNGLDQYVMTGVSKGGKLEFKADQWEVEGLREIVRGGKLAGARQMVLATTEEYYKLERSSAQAGAFVRYLLDGPGAQDKRTKGKLLEYFKVLGAFIKEREEAEKKAGEKERKEATTEEEEEQMAKARREEWKKKEKELLEEVARRAFPDLDDQGWAAVDRAWKKYVE